MKNLLMQRKNPKEKHFEILQKQREEKQMKDKEFKDKLRKEDVKWEGIMWKAAEEFQKRERTYYAQ